MIGIVIGSIMIGAGLVMGGFHGFWAHKAHKRLQLTPEQLTETMMNPSDDIKARTYCMMQTGAADQKSYHLKMMAIAMSLVTAGGLFAAVWL